MNLKLNFIGFLAITVFLWLVVLLRMFTIYTIVNNRPVVYELLLCGIIFQFTVISFLYNWYKYGRPKLVDYFKLSSFIFLGWNYLNIADRFDEKVGIYGEFYVNTVYVYPALVTLFVGILGLTLVDVIFSLIYSGKNAYELSMPKNEVLRSRGLFYILAFSLLAVQIGLLASGIVGYGSDSSNQTSSYSFVLQIVGNLASFFLCVFAILRYFFNASDKTFKRFYVLFILAYLIYGIMTGMKGTIIFGAVIILIPYVLSGRKIPVWFIAGSVAFLGFLYPFNNNYRNSVVEFPSMKRTDLLLLAADKTFSQPYLDNFKSSGTSYKDRLAMFPYVVYVQEYEKDWKWYKHMDRYPYLPVALVPRFLIPSKPVQDNGGKLQKMIMNNENNSITPTSYGWAYLEGNNWYVFLSFIVLGVAISVVQYSFRKNNFFYLIFYTNFIIQLLIIENEIYFLVAAIMQGLLVNYVFTKMLFKKNVQI